ncbi:DUF2069 domain-containing protein [Stenotrophomonas sp. SY1]|jgi:uncharacterized membrane protein|uniref:DUF2069 domain-containing protein n=1 Tax=Stenotrophomonas sp. SY1 TaxID=477235 RepID=UPI001E525A99|nr:DUF2069 domain-containing protein [Stenotrophomonas sp. SY1]MCD9086071.1 DUF2069 domain-containing protein [Stenotrophomonas sp. SY1]
MTPPSRLRDGVLALALLLLAALYGWWFRGDRHLAAVLLVFVVPPLLLLAGVIARRAAARFWAGVLALFWFSHGVMSAWAHREAALYAWLEIGLSLLIIGLVSVPGVRARFARKQAR